MWMGRVRFTYFFFMKCLVKLFQHYKYIKFIEEPEVKTKGPNLLNKCTGNIPGNVKGYVNGQNHH